MRRGNSSNHFGSSWIRIVLGCFILLWCYLLYSVLKTSHSAVNVATENFSALGNEVLQRNQQALESIAVETNKLIAESSSAVSEIVKTAQLHAHREIEPSNRADIMETGTRTVQSNEPPSIEEISRNMTLYLLELHSRLAAIAGPKVTGAKAWETFLDVTMKMPMQWDVENKHRQFTPRTDNSIYVALGTYRDPFCPMTIKSLFSQASHPEKLFVGLFQQNCFLKKCRTGVLVGGVVEDAGTDVNCYDEFCASQEGIRSNACNT